MIDRNISNIRLTVDAVTYYKFISSRNYNTVKEFEKKYGIIGTTANELLFDTEENKAKFVMMYV